MDRLIMNIERRPALETIFRELEEDPTGASTLFHSKYTFDGKLMRFLYKVHHSRKLNKLCNLPGKKLWDRWCPLLSMEFNPEDEYYICFIEIAALQYTHEELERLKSHKNVHMCLILFNPMDGLMQGDSPFSKLMKNFQFDQYFAIFDELDIKRAGFHRLTAIYSKLDDSELKSDLSESDYFYIGMAKDRQSTIQQLYRNIISAGKTADFTIVCPDPNVEKVDGIHYADDFLDYRDYLKHVQKTKCIVEILQGNQHGMTLRSFESFAYKKHLLTNNDMAEKGLNVNEPYTHYYREIAQADIASIELDAPNYEYADEFSPRNLLTQITNAK